MNIRLAHSTFLVVFLMIGLVAGSGYFISKNSLQDLTIDRVKHEAEQRTELYKLIWESAIHSELSQIQSIASFPIVGQGTIQPETHLEALRQTIQAALQKRPRFTATVVDFEGIPLVEVSQGERIEQFAAETLPAILDGSSESDIRFHQSDGESHMQLTVPILRGDSADNRWVEGAIITREPVVDIHSKIKPQHNHDGGRLVIADDKTVYFSVGSAEENKELPVSANIASTPYKIHFYPDFYHEKSLLIDRLWILTLQLGAVLVICMGIGYYLIERFLHDPMNGFMLALEEGKHSGTPIPIQRASRISEIRRLTDRYNEMTSEISAKQNELKHLNNSLRNKVVSQSREIATMQAAREKMKFLSGVSHELRTPLHAILGFTRLGLEKSQSQDQPAFERYFTKVDGNASALLALVDDVLDLTKARSSFQTEAMNSECMYTVILGVVEEMEAFCAESSINVRIVEKQSGLFVNIDSSRMQQVIRNLLSNAVRYSPPGADVVFEIVKRGNKCEVRILDSGVGIPQHELESIFDSFTRSSRTDKLAGGTGLGLAISRAIVSNHEGTLTAANRSGGGACFTITLPLPHRSTLAAA